MSLTANGIDTWFADYYLFATVLLMAAVAGNAMLRQPADRIVLTWSTLGGLVLLSGLLAVPLRAPIHLIEVPIAAEESFRSEPIVSSQPANLPPGAGQHVVTLGQDRAHTTSVPVASREMPSSAARNLPAAPLQFPRLGRVIGSGSALIAVWLIVGWWRAWRIKRSAVGASQRCRELYATVSDVRSTALLVSSELETVVATGLWRPSIIVPFSWLDLEDEDLRSVLAHEAAHIRHHHLWMVAAFRLLSLLLWAHPLFWWCCRQARWQQEAVADADAAQMTNRHEYAGRLLIWARNMFAKRPSRCVPGIGLWGTKSSLRRRITLLLDDNPIRTTCSNRRTVTTLCSFLLAAATLSLLTAQPGLAQLPADVLERLRAPNPFSSAVPGYPKWSPFTGVKWNDDQPMVRIDGQWYQLISFHGVSVEEILRHSEVQGWDTRKRFNEDLVQMLRLMGHQIERTADLVLRDSSGRVVRIKNVEMNESNRRRSMRESVRFISLNREDVLADLEVFQAALESRFSYLKANDADYRTAIQQIADRASDGMSMSQFAAELQQVLALFIDGHASVSSFRDEFEPGYLPFLIEPVGERFTAVKSDRSNFVQNELPYIRAIDGIELDRWLKATMTYVPRGSPQYRRRQGLRLLRHIQHFRQLLILPQSKTLEVELVNHDATQHRSLSLDVSAEKALYGTWPPVRAPEILEGNIGYLRLTQMDSAAVKHLNEWLPRFADTDGLVIDVRGNGGGRRTPILALASYLLSAQSAPRIGNVAKYRRSPYHMRDHLSSARYVYREDSSRFDERDREAIRRFKQELHPQWEPPEAEFSEWHYLVLSRDEADNRFHYSQPVAILLDEGCFSATDIFLGAFKGFPNVSLIGQPSGGGSARAQSFELPRSEIRFRCASMASFQPTGQLYDTNGVTPDIAVVRTPEYYVRAGQDVILQRALASLRDSGD